VAPEVPTTAPQDGPQERQQPGRPAQWLRTDDDPLGHEYKGGPESATQSGKWRGRAGRRGPCQKSADPEGNADRREPFLKIAKRGGDEGKSASENSLAH
jgi:hypothetical protein